MVLGASYCPTGHLVYSLINNNIGNLLAIPFDLDKLEVTGGSVPILEGIGAAAISDSGTLVYVPQPAVAAGSASAAIVCNTLWYGWTDREKRNRLEPHPMHYRDLKISPDGTKVALTDYAAGNQDIWIWDIPHKTPTKLTFDKADDTSPLWTPDGKRIVFRSDRGGAWWPLLEVSGWYWRGRAACFQARQAYLSHGLFPVMEKSWP